MAILAWSVGLVATCAAQIPEWVNVLDGDGYDKGRLLAFDANGNVYMAAEFEQQIDVDPDAIDEFILDQGDAQDAEFVAKYDASGDLLWAFALLSGTDPGADVDIVSVRCDPADGALYLLVSFSHTIDIDPSGSSTVELTATGVPSSGMDPRNNVLVKFSDSGTMLWSRQMTGDGFMEIYDLAVAPSGTVGICGAFNGAYDMNDLGASVTDSITGGFPPQEPFAFFARYDASGTFGSVQVLGPYAQATSIAFGQNDTLVALVNIRYFSTVLDIDPGTANYPVDASVSNRLLVKYAPDMHPVWYLAALGSYVPGTYTDLAIASDHSIHFSRAAEGELAIGDTTLSPQSAQLMLFKASVSGDLVWARGIEMSSGFGEDTRYALNGSGGPTLLLRSGLPESFDLDWNGSNTSALITTTGEQFVLVSYGADATFLYAGIIDHSTGYLELNDMVIMADGSVLLAGELQDEADFDLGTGISLASAPGTGEDLGAILVKYMDPTTGVPNSLVHEAAFSISPNPARNRLLVRPRHSEVTIRSYMIRDMRGALVLSSFLSASPSMLVIDLEGLASGIYLLEIASSAEERTVVRFAHE